jgi:hypothetical protein
MIHVPPEEEEEEEEEEEKGGNLHFVTEVTAFWKHSISQSDRLQASLSERHG